MTTLIIMRTKKESLYHLRDLIVPLGISSVRGRKGSLRGTSKGELALPAWKEGRSEELLLTVLLYGCYLASAFLVRKPEQLSGGLPETLQRPKDSTIVPTVLKDLQM